MKKLILLIFLTGLCHISYSQDNTVTDKIWKLKHAIINGEDYFFNRNDRKAPTMRMYNNNIRGFSGCNSYKAKYTLDGKNIVISGLSHSYMNCAEGIPKLPESDYQQALMNSFTLDLDAYHGTLTMYVEGGDYFKFELFSEKP